MKYTAYCPTTGEKFYSGDGDEPHRLANELTGIFLGSAPENSYYSNGEWIDIPLTPSPVHTWDWSSHTWVDQRTLAQVKEKKWNELKAIRDELEQSGFPYLGSVFDSDRTSVNRINLAVSAAQKGIAEESTATVKWTLADNTTKIMTLEEVVGMPVALFQHGEVIHLKSQNLRELIESSTTITQVEAITWET